MLVNTDFPVVFYEPLPHSAVDPATQYHVFMWAPIGIGTHSSIVSRTMTMCIYVLSPNLILVPDARHYYPLIINASQAIRVPTSLVTATSPMAMILCSSVGANAALHFLQIVESCNPGLENMEKVWRA